MRNVYRFMLLGLLLLGPALVNAQLPPIKVQNLPAATSPPAAGDYGICDQSAVTNKCTYQQIATGVGTLLSLGTWASQNYPPFVINDCLSNNGATWVWITCSTGGSGGTPSFSAITPGINTNGNLQVGSGSTLAPTGSGSILATQVVGLNVTSGKTLAATNSVTLTGTDGTSFTLPSASDTLAGLNAVQTLSNKTLLSPVFTGTAPIIDLSNAINLSLTTGVVGVLPQANGGSGAVSLVAAKIPVSTGSLTTGDCLSIASSTLLTIQDAGVTCGGGGGGGSGTVTSGTANYLTYYPASTASVSAASPAVAIGILNSGSLSTQTGTPYNALLTDANTATGMSNASANVFCVPSNVNVAFPVGTSLTVEQTSTGATTVAQQGVAGCSGTSGVVAFTSVQYGSSTTQTLALAGVYDLVQIRKTATDTWELVAAGPGRATQAGLVSLGSNAFGGVTGTLSVTNGGTGQTTASAAINALLPSQTGQSGNCLGTNGTASSWVTCGSGGSGTPGGSNLQIQYNNSGSFGGYTAPQAVGYLNSAAVNAQTNTTYTPVIGDANLIVTMNNAAAQTLTMPPNASVAFSVGTTLTVEQLGAGVTSIVPGAGVTFCSLQYGCSTSQTYAMAGAYDLFQLKQTATNSWLVTAVGPGRAAQSALTNLAATTPGGITGQLPVGNISATGTPSSSTYLRGDGTWSTGTGTVTGAQLNNANNFTATQTFSGGIGAYTTTIAANSGSACTLTSTGTGGCNGLATGVGDCGTTITFSSSSAVTVTVPAALATGCQVAIKQGGTGKVSVNGAAATPATLQSFGGYTGTAGQYAKIGVSMDASGVATLSGAAQ